MTSKYLLLWLEAPLQSWGFDSRFNRRDTLEFPTKSGILGLLLCAMGLSGEQREILSRFASLKQTVLSYEWRRANKKPEVRTLLHDFQMIGSGYNTDKKSWEYLMIPKTDKGGDAKRSDGSIGGTKITHRYYLQDAKFAAVVEIPSDLSEEIARALQNPAWPLYLGRRCCIPTELIYRGTFDSEEDALQHLQEYLNQRAEERNTAERFSKDWQLHEIFRVVDGQHSGGGFNTANTFILNDVPIQFGKEKKYRDRTVTKILTQPD